MCDLIENRSFFRCISDAREDLKMLAGIGMSPEHLSAFTQRLKIIAQRHSMKPEVTCSKLMDELEQLEEGLGLDTVLKNKKEELDKLENTMLKAKEASERLSTTNEKLREERTTLTAALSEEQRHFVTDIGSINTAVKNVIAELRRNFDTAVRESSIGVNKLRNAERKTLKAAFEEEQRYIITDLKAIDTVVKNTTKELKQNLGDGVSEGTIEINKLRNQALIGKGKYFFGTLEMCHCHHLGLISYLPSFNI
ncbi:hypothetical protein ACFLV0_02755 [Chloroflexota bacterium]